MPPATFSATSNPNGSWSYGWSLNRGSLFNLDTSSSNVSGLEVWNFGGPDVFYNPTSSTINPAGTNPIPPGTLAFHPGPNGENAIVRWTAPTAGSYNIAATFTGRDFVGPTTTDVAVLLNGSQLWVGEVTGYLADVSFSAAPLALNAGDTIDFTLGFGTDGNYYYDSTGLAAQVISVDTTPPVVAITTPTQGAVYSLNQSVIASYSCIDPDSPSISCVGPVANGTGVDTSTLGSKTFTVVGTDQAGNQGSATSAYSVGYAICYLYDQTTAVRSGAVIPIKLEICDANGIDDSASTIALTAIGLTQISSNAPGTLASPGNSNPDNNFRFDATLGSSGGYIFNLSTSSLSTGTYVLSFTAAGDPTVHTAQFQVK